MTLEETEQYRRGLQEELDEGKDLGERRAMGQFATPYELATDIVAETKRYLPKKTPIRMLEPSMGTGAFVSAAHAILGDRLSHVVGYELDGAFYKAAVELWAKFGDDVRQEDFVRIEPQREFNLVLANPPYVRHHMLSVGVKRMLKDAVLKGTGLNLSGLAGMYCHFLLLSRAWMREGAIGAWLIPSEWMSVNYGETVRAFLSMRVKLLRVHCFDTSDVRFSDALVSSCVVWFRNAPPDGEVVEFTFGPDIRHPARKEYCGRLPFHEKWPPRHRAAMGRSCHLGDYFDIRRGIATGDNGFFVLPETKAKEKAIPDKFLKPILPSPRYLKVEKVESDADGVPTNADRRFLLDCTGYSLEELPASVRAYLQTGIETTARRNLCASRPVWYAQEQRAPAPILCSYMGRGCGESAPVRFILNDSRAIASNSFLMLYPKGLLSEVLAANPAKRSKVWECLCRIPASAISDAGRSYGGGLQKVEPKELGNVPCPELEDCIGSKLALMSD